MDDFRAEDSSTSHEGSGRAVGILRCEHVDLFLRALKAFHRKAFVDLQHLNSENHTSYFVLDRNKHYGQHKLDTSSLPSIIGRPGQAISGDQDGAKKTQEEFLRTGLLVSQCYALAKTIEGDEEEARKSQLECLKVHGQLIDGVPIVGHGKGLIHYVCGDREGGDQAMLSASRTSVVLGAAAFALPTGPAGCAAAAVGAGIGFDAAASGIDAAANDKKFSDGSGVASTIARAVDPDCKSPDSGEWFDTSFGVALDAFAGRSTGARGRVGKSGGLRRPGLKAKMQETIQTLEKDEKTIMKAMKPMEPVAERAESTKRPLGNTAEPAETAETAREFTEDSNRTVDDASEPTDIAETPSENTMESEQIEQTPSPGTSGTRAIIAMEKMYQVCCEFEENFVHDADSLLERFVKESDLREKLYDLENARAVEADPEKAAKLTLDIDEAKSELQEMMEEKLSLKRAPIKKLPGKRNCYVFSRIEDADGNSYHGYNKAFRKLFLNEVENLHDKAKSAICDYLKTAPESEEGQPKPKALLKAENDLNDLKQKLEEARKLEDRVAKEEQCRALEKNIKEAQETCKLLAHVDDLLHKGGASFEALLEKCKEKAQAGKRIQSYKKCLSEIIREWQKTGHLEELEKSNGELFLLKEAQRLNLRVEKVAANGRLFSTCAEPHAFQKMKTGKQAARAVSTATIEINGQEGTFRAKMRCANCSQFIDDEFKGSFFYGDVPTDIEAPPGETLPPIPAELPRLRSMMKAIEESEAKNRLEFAKERRRQLLYRFVEALTEFALSSDIGEHQEGKKEKE